MDDLHARLAAAGVPLFDAPVVEAHSLDRRALADLLVDILSAGKATVAVTIPSLLAAQAGPAAGAVADAAARLPGESRRRLGLLYRLARCLAMSRRPDLEFRFGRAVDLPPWEGEPVDLPDPAERYGHSCLREAADDERNPVAAGIAGDAERTFDQWLRILAVEQGRP